MLLALISLLASAQPNLTFYPFDDQFNSSDYNPSFLTSSQQFTFSMFPLGGASINYNHQKDIRKMVSNFLSGISSDNDYRKFLESMVSESTFHQNLETSLLSFTYHSNFGFFNFRIKECESFSAQLESDLAKFILKSDIRSVGINQQQDMPIQAIHYREYSLGYSFKSRMKRLSAGIRAKVYFGKSAVYSGLSGSIQKENGEYIFRSLGLVNLSFPENMVSNPGTTNSTENNGTKAINYILNRGNPGFGVDLGIRYRFTPDLTFSMSAIDIGKINWNTNLNSKIFNVEYKLPGNSFTNTALIGEGQTITKTIENYTYSDSIAKIFRSTYERSAFSRPLPITFYTGIKYRYAQNLSFCLTDRYVWLKDMDYNSFSFAVTYDINKKITISSGYSAISDSYINIPLALLIRKKNGQFYIGTDNLISIVAPSYAKFAGFSFGACFYLFKNRDLTWKSSDELPFYRPRKIKKNRNSGKILKAYSEN